MNTWYKKTFAMNIIKARLFERLRPQKLYYPGEVGKWMNSLNSLAVQ